MAEDGVQCRAFVYKTRNIRVPYKTKKKVKFTLQHAMQVRGRDRRIALLFH